MRTVFRWILLFLGAAAAFHALFFLIGFYLIYPLNYINPPVTSLMTYRALTSGAENQPVLFTPLAQMTKNTLLMAVDIEDSNFYKHWGFDPSAIKRAMQINSKLGFIARGGSTITQQLARTLFLVPQKNYYRKYIEILMAVLMEQVLSKERILELYLNSVEWGNGIYGIRQASRYYYKKKPSELSDNEAARLLTILPSPLHYQPYTFENNVFLKRRYKILLNFLK